MSSSRNDEAIKSLIGRLVEPKKRGLRGLHYRPIQTSKVLPGIDLDELVSLLDRPTASRAIKDYRATVTRRKRR